jgi:uncharacterized protein YdaT
MAKMPKNVHVAPHSKGWEVKKDNAQRASSVHPTQKEAIEKGKQVCRDNSAELKIHGKDGKIRESNSYGNDPCPPKG